MSYYDTLHQAPPPVALPKRKARSPKGKYNYRLAPLTDADLAAHRHAALTKMGILTHNVLVLAELVPHLDRLRERRAFLLRRHVADQEELAPLATEEQHLLAELAKPPTA